MSELLEKLGFKKRIHVGISLSANNFIELICINKTSKSVTKYASGNIKYNNAIREIIDYDEFTEVVEGLFEEAGLNPAECCVTLNLPNVHFGIASLDNVSETPYIIENLQGEIEDLYIFKRNEPAISYSILNPTPGKGQQSIVYSALQSKVIGQMIEIFDSMQAELVRIDNSYSSLLKAIQFCDRFNKYVQKDEKTLILLVTPNSCCNFYMHGNHIVDCFEEPIAVKSFSTEEVYSTISKIATNAIEKNHPSSLLIISETDEVNAELLSSGLTFSGTVDYINKSINSSEQFIEVTGVGGEIDANMISYLTIEAVGSAVADYDDYPLNINFMPAERVNPNMVEVGNYEVDLYRFIIILFVGAAFLASLIGFGVKSILQNQIDSVQDTNRTTQDQIEVFKRRTTENSQAGKKNIFPTLKKIVDNNIAILTVYNLLSTEIPENVYIKKFVTNADGGIGILGEAKSGELVEAFAKGLREKNEDLMVSKLSINSMNDIIPSRMVNGYTFEIKTQSTDVSLNEQEDLIRANIENTMSNINQVQPTQGGFNGNIELPPGQMTPPPPVI